MQQQLCIGYLRVSTEDQAVNGVSLAVQEQRISAYALATDRRIDSFVEDAGESAKTLHRPGMASILELTASRKLRTLVVLKLDRLTRSVRDLSYLIELFQRRKVTLVSVSESLDTSTASGRLFINLLGSIGQWERESIAERTSHALAHLRRERRLYGHIPFGYRRTSSGIAPDDTTQEALKTMRAMRLAGASFARIAIWLNEHGIKPSQRATLWRRATVSEVLSSRISIEDSQGISY